MIRPQDAVTLALTKLRTRKIRLVVTIVISGLLFSGLAGASFVARGIIGGIADFGKEGLGERYIAQAFSQSGGMLFNDPAVMDRAVAIHKDTVARKKVEAKRLGIEYDAASDQSPIMEYDAPGGKQRNLDIASPAARQALDEYFAAHPPVGEKELTAIAKKYGVKGQYKSKQLPFDLNGAQLQVLKDGKESFEQSANNKQGPQSGTDSFIGSWQVMSGELLRPFILPGEHLALGADGSVPIIVPFSAAEQLLKLTSLPKSAPSEERLARTKEVRERAASVTFAVCYRNDTSVDLVAQAVSVQQEIERSKNNKDYQKPELIYGLPGTPCGAVPVARDVRSKAVKQLADKQQQFDALFGAAKPEQATFIFRVVGVVPDPDYSASAGVGQIVRSLVTSSLGTGWYSPFETVQKNPILATLFEGNSSPFGTFTNYYIEFGSAASARKFIDTESCRPNFAQASSSANFDPFASCVAEGKPFELSAYGSNSLALEDAKRMFGKIFGIAALVVALIACIIMMGTVGRMIADSRRETAVFRAIGAKKLDIAQIYLLYTVFLAVLISIFAALLGLVFALIMNARFGPEVTLHALVAYNAQDLNKTFTLYGFYGRDILYLFGLAILAGLISALLPLVRNLRRNPIRDMRDDT